MTIAIAVAVVLGARGRRVWALARVLFEIARYRRVGSPARESETGALEMTTGRIRAHRPAASNGLRMSPASASSARRSRRRRPRWKAPRRMPPIPTSDRSMPTSRAVCDACRPLAKYRDCVSAADPRRGAARHRHDAAAAQLGRMDRRGPDADRRAEHAASRRLAITYGRRYGLAAMVGIAPEDDDGEAAEPRNATADPDRHLSRRPPAKPTTKPPGQVRHAGGPASSAGRPTTGRGRCSEAWKKSGRT